MASSSPSASRLPTWEHVWHDAQPRISQIQSSLLSTVSPLPRITRVGQVDAELLDQELVQLLKEPLVKAFSQVNSPWKARHDPELTLFVELVLYKLSVWNQGASFGAKLQGLKYEVQDYKSKTEASSAACGLPRRLLLAHGLATILVPYLHTRIRTHALSNAWPDAPSSDRRRKAWAVLTRLESLHALFGLLNFILFLWNGRYRTSMDRLLGMKLVSARRLARRDVSYEFMNRQMVWHAFTEFLLFLLPLINTRALRRRLASLLSHYSPLSIMPAPVRSLFSSQDPLSLTGKRRRKHHRLSPDQCAICADNASPNLLNPAEGLEVFTNAHESASIAGSQEPFKDGPPPHPINTPYRASCGHVYCYYCLADRMLRTADDRTGVGPGGSQWECLRCCEGVVSAHRVEAHIEGPEYESGAEDELDFGYNSEELEFTDMSGSIGTYSESGLSE